MAVVGKVCLEIRFLLQKYDKNGSHDHSRRLACRQAVKSCTADCSGICSQSTVVTQQWTRQGWCGGFPRPFFSIVHSFIMFASARNCKRPFSSSFASISIQSRVTIQTSSALRPWGPCRGFTHCSAAFYSSGLCFNNRASKLTEKPHCSPVTFSAFELLGKNNWICGSRK